MFYDSWQNISALEQNAIKSLSEAKDIILQNIPHDQIIAIYVKGSFPRREMNEKSDVDTVTILKETSYLKHMQELEEQYRQQFNPPIQLAAYSLEELTTGARLLGKEKANPSRFLKHVPHHKLIYGTAINPQDYPMRSDQEDYESLKQAFSTIFLPAYQKGEYGFSEIVKQVFWLIENEERAKGAHPPHNWHALAKALPNHHILQQALHYRDNPTKDKKQRAEFISKVQNYLK